MFNFNSRFRFLALATIMLLLVTAPGVMAQQTVDPTGVCTVDSTRIEINAQTGTFICKPTTPGASTGVWANIAYNMQVAHVIYSFATDGGAVSTITPLINANIPANSIIFGVILNPTTALTSGGSATIAVGTSAGSSTTSLKGATAVASYTIDALMAGTPVFTAGSAVKLSAAGSVTLTVATAALTAGVMEVFVFYVPAKNA